MKNNYKTIGVIIVCIVLLGMAIYGFVTKEEGTFNNYNDAIEVFNEEKDKNTKEEKTSLLIVEIKGEVKNPSVYKLEEGSVVLDLIEKAGGTTENADISNINRAEKLKSNTCITIRNKNDIAKSEDGTQQQKGTVHKSDKVNINTATEQELDTLPGVGSVTAKNIINYREQNGGFKKIEDIMNIDKIGDKMFEKLKDKIEV